MIGTTIKHDEFLEIQSLKCLWNYENLIGFRINILKQGEEIVLENNRKLL